MKKVLSFVLVLSMILGSFGMAFAATDVEGSEYKDALTVLVGLGVIDGYADGTVKPEKVVTRAEAATLIIKAMDLQDYAVGKSAFTDMAGHWADAFVAYAVSLGFVAGNTDGTFAPDAPVTSDQMITMLVQAIGYKGEYLTGGYPGAFVNTAKALGMLKDVKAGTAGCTRGEVAQMIYNSLDVPFVTYTKDGEAVDSVMLAGGKDCFKARLISDKDEKETIVKANEDSKIDLKPYQGLKATLIYDDTDVVAVDAIKSVFIEGKLSADGKTFELADKTEYKLKSNISTTAAIYHYFENGIYDTSATNAALASVAGVTAKLAVELDGNYIKRVDSIAKWDAADTIKWDEADAEALEEEVPTLNNVGFIMTNKDKIDTTKFILEGATSLDAIPEDAIVTYYVANIDNAGDAEIVKVAVSTTVVTGKVTEITKDKELVIGGKAYDVATGAAIVEVAEKDQKLGAEGKFYLNAAGEIAYADTTGAADDYAWVVLAPANDNVGYDAADSFKIKLQAAEGKASVYKMTKAAYKTASNGAVATGALVVYELNSDNEISEIATKATISAVNQKLTAKGYLAGYKVAADVTVFVYDAEDGFVAGSLKDVPVDEKLTAKTSYYVDPTSKEVVVIFTADNATEEDVYGMIVGYSEVQNADEKNVYKVTLLAGGVEKTVLTVADGFGDASDLTSTSLCAFDFEADELKAIETTTVGITSGAVEKTQDGNVAFTTSGAFLPVADDVVVYEVSKDNEVSVSSFAKVVKKANIEMYQLDAADKDEDGYDVIIIRK